jgi:hypothetical protein
MACVRQGTPADDGARSEQDVRFRFVRLLEARGFPGASDSGRQGHAASPASTAIVGGDDGLDDGGASAAAATTRVAQSPADFQFIVFSIVSGLPIVSGES